MKSRTIVVCASALVAVTASVTHASERDRPWCRQFENSRDPMIWSEDFGVAHCNNRALTPYQPWDSAAPVRHDQSDPMVARDDWRVNGFSDYDRQYDDHYDRRSHRYR
jgi:hypothetical protein